MLMVIFVNFELDNLCILLEEMIETVKTGNYQNERVVTVEKERSVTIANTKSVEKENQTSNSKMLINPIMSQDYNVFCIM